MLSRLRAVLGVLMLVMTIGALPLLAPPAQAGPRNLTVATYELDPFVISRGDGVRSGFTIDLLEEIAKRTGWTYSYIDGKDVRGLLNSVQQGRADMAATNISITADREQYLDFSQPVLTAGLQIAIPVGGAEHTVPGLAEFVALLTSKTMLLWLFAALVLAVLPAHIVWLTERAQPDSPMSRAYFPGIFQAFIYGLGMLASQPDEFPRHWANRILGILLAFVSIVFAAYFTAILTSNFTVEKITSEITGPTDLIGKRVCATADTTSAAALTKMGVQFTGVPDTTDCYAGLKDNRFDAIVNDSPILRYWVTHDGDGIATLAGPVFKPEDYGVIFPLNSPLTREFNRALLTMQEDGDFALLEQKWFGNAG